MNSEQLEQQLVTERQRGQMTQVETEQIKKLFKLANIAQEMEFVDFKTIDHFNTLRETHGLSKLLMLIQEYATTKANTYTATTYPSQTQDANQNTALVQ